MLQTLKKSILAVLVNEKQTISPTSFPLCTIFSKRLVLVHLPAQAADRCQRDGHSREKIEVAGMHPAVRLPCQQLSGHMH